MAESKHLNRSLGLGLAVVLVLGNIIGSGVFKKVAPMAAELHSSGWILICWVLGGLITMFGAVSNAEIASMLADTGGEYSYYKKIYNKFFSYIYGWANFATIKTAGIASVAYVFSQSLNSLFPFPQMLTDLENVNIYGIFYPFKDFNVKFVCILMIVTLTWYNSRGLKLGAHLSTILLIIVLVGMLVLIITGNSSPEADLSRAFSMDTGTSGAVTFSAVFTAMLAAFWAFEGWNSIGFLGGEIKNAHKNLPLAIIFGLLGVIIIYLLVNMTYVSVLSIHEIEAINAVDTKVAAIETAGAFWGSKGIIFLSVVIIFSTLGCTHATILSNARTSYAMAIEGLFFRKMSVINNHNVPGNALWYQAVWASMLVLSGTFDQLTDMLIFAAFIFYGATTMGVFILRRKMPEAIRPYKAWGYPVVPALFIIFCLFLLGNTIIARPREAAIGTSLILIGVPFYFWFRRKGRKEITGTA